MIQKQKTKTLPIETGTDIEDVVQLTGRSFKQGWIPEGLDVNELNKVGNGRYKNSGMEMPGWHIMKNKEDSKFLGWASLTEQTL